MPGYVKASRVRPWRGQPRPGLKNPDEVRNYHTTRDISITPDRARALAIAKMFALKPPPGVEYPSALVARS